MTDFALYHEGSWRDGEIPKITARIYVVSYDTRHDAYVVQNKKYAEFLEWLASIYQDMGAGERQIDEYGEYEDAEDFLERIEVNVYEARPDQLIAFI